MNITLHVTAACNFRCRYCYAAPHSDGVMGEETARASVDMALAGSPPTAAGPSLGIVFFGGEPLLHPDLIRATIRYCRDITDRTGRSFHFKLTTNGSLLDESFLADRLTGEVFVALSHDGVQPAHDTHRVDAEGRGTFDRLEPVIDLLLSHRPHAPVMLVTTPETAGWYADSVRYLFGRGFRYLICSLNYAAGWSQASLATLERQYQELAEWYVDQTEREEKFYFSPFDVKIASRVFPGSCRRERCELGRRQISVAPSGRIFPCVQFVGDGGDSEWCIGNVRSGIDEARRGHLYRENDREKESCRGCAIGERCNHFCGCLNRQATGSIRTVSPVLCSHEQMVLKIADTLAERLFRKRSAMFLQKQYNELFPLLSLAEDHAACAGGRSCEEGSAP